MIRLSFAIPTYNRPQALREAVQSIVVAATGFEDQVDITITDNGDGTAAKDAIQEASQSKVRIRYIKNEVNIGAERNLLKAVDMTEGEYIWNLSDDDRITSDAIKEVFKRIDAGHNLIICNFSIWSKDYSEVKVANNFRTVDDMTFTRADEALGRFSVQAGYISCVIMKRTSLYSVPISERDSFIGTGFPWLYPIYASLLSHCSVAFIAKLIVQNRSDNSVSYDWHNFFINGTTRIFKALQAKGYSPRAVRVANRRVILDYVIHNLLGLRLNKTKKRGLALLLVKAYPKEWLTWGVCLPIWTAPLSLVEKHRDDIIRLPYLLPVQRPTMLHVP